MKFNKLFGFVLMFFLSLVSVGFGALTDNNIAYWSFDDGLNNFSNFGVTGTQGILDGGYNFDGVNDYITNDLDLSSYSDYSFNVWVSLNSPSTGQEIIISNNAGTATNGDFEFKAIGPTANKPQIFLRGSTNLVLESNTPILDSNFHMITYVKNGNSHEMYLDNTLVASATSTNTINSKSLNIGRNPAGSSFLDGKMDEFSIYPKALSQTEINNIYQGGNPTQKTIDIVSGSSFYSSMDSLDDLTGNLNYLNANNGVESNTNGLLNNAFNFDTSTDYINAGDVFSGGTFSISTWINLNSAPASFQRIINVDEGSGNQRFFGMSVSNTNVVNTRVYNSAGGVLVDCVGSTVLNPNTWYNVVYTYNATTDTCNLYLNNVLEVTATSSGSTINPTINAIIGNYNAGNSQALLGIIDEMSIWDNKELTTTEISQLYNSGNGFNPYETIIQTPTIQHNIKPYYNKENISIVLETNNFVDMYYSLDNLNYISILNNTKSTYNTINQPIKLVEGFPSPIPTLIYPDDLSAKQYCLDTGYIDFYNYTIDNSLSSGIKYNGTDWINIIYSSSIKDISCNQFGLFNLNDTKYNISFKAIDNNGESITTASFTIDTTNPILEVNFTTEYNSYDNFNFSQYINVSDINLDTCIITISGETQTTCSETSYNFTTSGNKTINISATDLAGNKNEVLNQNILINPYFYLYFKDSNNNVISNFKINNEIINDSVYKKKYYNNGFIIGYNEITFEKLGFKVSDLNFTLNTTAPKLEQNFTIQNSKIVLKIYDHSTGQLITTPTSITLIATNYTDSTTTGEKNISSIYFYDGEYQLILTNDNYQTERVYFNYNNKEILNVNAYMLPINLTNLGILNVKVQDSINIISGQLVNLQAWDSTQSAFITVGQAKTDSNGDAYFNVQLNDILYKVVSIKNGILVETPEQVIATSGSIIYVIFSNNLQPIVKYNGEGISGSVTNEYYNTTHDLVKFSYNDINNLVTKACLEVNRLNGDYKTSLSTPLCINSPSGEIQIITSNNNTYTKEILGVVYIDNTKINIDNLIYSSNLSFESSIKDLGKWIILVIFIGIIGLGVTLGNINILSIGTIFISWITYSIFPTTLSYTIPLLITIIMLLVLYGTFKKRF